jgi:uncharacterized protein (TIGR03083 family)
VQYQHFLEAIARESTALADAAEQAGLQAVVPSCPDWTVADLVSHIGTVQVWATTIVEQDAIERVAWDSLPEAPNGDDLVPWLRGTSAALVAALSAADPSAPAWTFGADRTNAFWARRQAQEVAIHRWDAQVAAGVPQAIDTALAADGIDELLGMRAKLGKGTGETIHLHCTDDALSEGGEWLIRLLPEGAEIERAHAKGDVAARGTASELDLFVWGRVPATTLEVFGDAALLGRFRQSVSM